MRTKAFMPLPDSFGYPGNDQAHLTSIRVQVEYFLLIWLGPMMSGSLGERTGALTKAFMHCQAHALQL